MAKNKVKKFSIVDKKLRKFRNEDNVQPNHTRVSRLRNSAQADKWVQSRRPLGSSTEVIFSWIKLSYAVCSR